MEKQIKLDSRPARHGGPMENKAMETAEACASDSAAAAAAAYEGSSPDFAIRTDPSARSPDLFSKEPEEPGENLREILKWVRPLPPLLSPIQFSPGTTPDILIGELTDSSDEEMDQDAQMLESIFKNYDPSAPEPDIVSETNPAELQNKYNSSSVNNESSDPCESPGRPTAVKHNKSVLCLDRLVAASGSLSKIGAKSKDGEKQLEENSMERDTEIAVHGIENITKSTADVTEKENKTLVHDLMSGSCLQAHEKTAEPKHVQEVVTSSFEQARNEPSDLMKEEREEATGAVEASVSSLIEDDRPSACKGGSSSQQAEEPVLATKNTLVVPDEDGPSNMIKAAEMKEGSVDIQTEPDSGRARSLTEHTAPEQNRTEEFCTQHHGEPEFTDRKMNLDHFKFHSATDHHIDQAQHQCIEVALMQGVEKDNRVADASLKLYQAEENYSSKDSECDVYKQTELADVDALRPKFNIIQAVGEWENSLSCTNEVIQTGNECSTAPSTAKNEEGDKPKIESEKIVSKNKTAGSIIKETLSAAMTENCLQVEDHHNKKDSIRSLQGEPSDRNVPKLPAQVSVVTDCLSQPEGPVGTNQAAHELETITGNASDLEKFNDSDEKLERKLIIHNISNSIQSPEVMTEEECLEEDSSESLKITTAGTVQLATSREGEKGTASGIVPERPAQSCLGTGNSQCDGIGDVLSQEITCQNDKSPSPETRESAVQDVERSVTHESVLEENPNGGSAQSMQDASEAENRDPRAVIPVALTIGSKSTNLPASSLEVKFEVSGRNGQGTGETACVQSSDSPCIAPSTRANHNDHHKSEGSEESRHKLLDDCSCNDPEEVESKRAGEQSTSSETQATVDVRVCCEAKDSREIFEAPSGNDASTVHTSAAIQTILSDDRGMLTTCKERIENPSRNCMVEHPLNATVSKEMDELLNSEARSEEADEIKTPDAAVGVMDLSASSSSEEEYPLRKVNPMKQDSRHLAPLDTIQNSQTRGPPNAIASCGIRGLPCLAEDASPKDDQATVHIDDTDAVEVATAKTLEQSGAAPCSSENSFSALEASNSDEKQADKNIALMNRALVDNKEPASRKLPATDLELTGDVLSSEAERSGTDVETSGAHSTFPKEKWGARQERDFTALGWSSNVAQNHLISHPVDGSTTASYTEENHVKNNGEVLAALTSENSILPNSKCSSTEQQEVVSQKSELFVESCTGKGAEQVLKPSEFAVVSAKTGAEGGCGKLLPRIPSRKGKRKSRQDSLTETIVANADTSTSAKHFPKTLRKIRQEMGPPLPPLLPPLIATPPRTMQPVSPVMSSSSQSSLPSPLSELISPLRETPLPPLMSPLSDTPKHKLPAKLTASSPFETLIGERTLSSPLQFCAITPKHALPVPGRLPPSAAGSAAPTVPQENSVKILDSMYPELSARAITLNILKGNIQLSRSSSLDGKNVQPSVHQISGLKEIASASTAFVKTGSTSFSELPSSNVSKTGKRMLASPAMPKSAKRLRLDSELLKSDLGKEELSAKGVDRGTQKLVDETALGSGDTVLSVADSRLLLPAEEIDPDSRTVTVALEKISESCFDLFPVIRSRVHVGNTSTVPIMRDEEKEVVYEFGVAKKCLAEPALQAILNKLKHQKTSLEPCHVHALCRVYVGICRQLGDVEKARLFCFSLLKEDFPQPGKLILYMGNMWNEIFTSEGVINKAVQLVARKRSKGQVLKYLKTFLNWEESGPADISMMISSLLLAIQLCPQMQFQASTQHGEDLKESMWEYVFAIDLLCSHQKWAWTHDHIISKELWPIMDKWINNRKGSGNTSSPSDVIVATVLRLIGRLSQIGLKEGFSSAVKNISSVIGAFLQHAKEKDVPWAVQLAAVYALCELAPSSPSEVLEAIKAWEAVNANSLPPAVTSGIAEVSSLLKQ
ncbi:little elongation complex subunit 1 isoform X2 [Eublepharis macularius]|uniref:Little elongation complex subunit 1 isoform X2 n=1 Tax=Eublepharis macularius TaxID=481883 RepID=A0AA97JN17_EUBMA|nr:little elongation complex subunit 1 isoform X2 [Eublepharis macularius]